MALIADFLVDILGGSRLYSVCLYIGNDVY